MSEHDLSLLAVGWKEGFDLWWYIVLLMTHEGKKSDHPIVKMEVKGVKCRRPIFKALQINDVETFQGSEM